jgi:hypothetical protein
MDQTNQSSEATPSELKSFPDVVDMKDKQFYINFRNFMGESVEEWRGTLAELKAKLYREYPDSLAEQFYEAFEAASKKM